MWLFPIRFVNSFFEFSYALWCRVSISRYYVASFRVIDILHIRTLAFEVNMYRATEPSSILGRVGSSVPYWKSHRKERPCGNFSAQ